MDHTYRERGKGHDREKSFVQGKVRGQSSYKSRVAGGEGGAATDNGGEIRVCVQVVEEGQKSV